MGDGADRRGFKCRQQSPCNFIVFIPTQITEQHTHTLTRKPYIFQCLWLSRRARSLSLSLVISCFLCHSQAAVVAGFIVVLFAD